MTLSEKWHEIIKLILNNNILMAAFVAMISAGAHPTYTILMEKYYGKTICELNTSEEYKKIMDKNLSCIRNINNQPISFITKDKKSVQVTTCPETGDMLVEVALPDPTIPPIIRWYSINQYNDSSYYKSIFNSSLFAQDSEIHIITAPINLCINTINNNFIRVINYGAKGCWKFIFNEFNELKLQKQVGCNNIQECDKLN
jgi:hypothetical protein